MDAIDQGLVAGVVLEVDSTRSHEKGPIDDVALAPVWNALDGRVIVVEDHPVGVDVVEEGARLVQVFSGFGIAAGSEFPNLLELLQIKQQLMQ